MDLGQWIICSVWVFSKVMIYDYGVGGCEAEGQAEIYHNNTWGAISSGGMGDTEADVICRSLPGDYEGGYIFQHEGVGNGPIWLSGLICSESFKTVDQCMAGMPLQWGSDEWGITPVAWVRCTKEGYDDSSCFEHNPDDPGELKIDGDCTWEGRLLVSLNHTWRTVCAKGFGDESAVVACRQLKFRTGWSKDIVGVSDRGMKPIGRVNCTGTESTLEQCKTESLTTCPLGLLAGVTCATTDDQRRECSGNIITSRDGDIRLRERRMTQETQGQLQEFFHGQWVGVCGPPVRLAIKLACRRLGFSDGNQITKPRESDNEPADLDVYYTGNCVNEMHCPLAVQPIGRPCRYLWISCYNSSPTPPSFHHCEPNPCHNGGQCSVAREGEVHCHCTPGYTGDICDTKMEDTRCPSNPCQNNGTCMIISTWFTCRCKSGYVGHLCNIHSEAAVETRHTMTTVAIVLGVIVITLLIAIIGMVAYFTKCRGENRKFPGMQRLDEEMSVISDHQDDIGDECN